ncbi:MAG: GGDEF domain-containing protein [Deinococcales bacterium]
MGDSEPTHLLSRLGRLIADLLTAFQRPTGSHTSIREVVADVHGVERFRWVLGNTVRAALALHTVFIVLFAALGVWPLAAVNLGSVMLYALALAWVRRGHLQAAFAVTALEIVVHAFVATIFLSLSSGFFIYIPLATVLTFLQPQVDRTTKVVWGIGEALAFLGVVALGEATDSMVHLPSLTLSALAVANAFLFVASLGFLAYVTQEAAQSAERDLRIALARLDELARTDTLTGLLNRRAMSELLDAEATRVARHGRPFSVLIADLDDFKGINDAHGHAAGDHALRCVAQRLLGAVRAQDQVARWGGEEFLLLLPETDLETGLQVAERLRAAVSEPPLQLDGVEIRSTATIGVAVFEQGHTVFDAIRSADRALYTGKGLGKDRVVRGAE